MTGQIAGTYYEVTEDNLEEAREDMAAEDQAAELIVGCKTWGIYYDPGSQRGQMTAWPNGRGAVCCGADSDWGDWNPDVTILTLDDSTRIDTDGEPMDGEA